MFEVRTLPENPGGGGEYRLRDSDEGGGRVLKLDFINLTDETVQQ